MKTWMIAILTVVLLVSTACGTTPADSSNGSSVTPAAGASPEEDTQDAEAALPTGTNWLAVEGKTDDNLTFLGNPDAPVTIIDYSDFL